MDWLRQSDFDKPAGLNGEVLVVEVENHQAQQILFRMLFGLSQSLDPFLKVVRRRLAIEESSRRESDVVRFLKCALVETAIVGASGARLI